MTEMLQSNGDEPRINTLDYRNLHKIKDGVRKKTKSVGEEYLIDKNDKIILQDPIKSSNRKPFGPDKSLLQVELQDGNERIVVLPSAKFPNRVGYLTDVDGNQNFTSIKPGPSGFYLLGVGQDTQRRNIFRVMNIKGEINGKIYHIDSQQTYYDVEFFNNLNQGFYAGAQGFSTDGNPDRGLFRFDPIKQVINTIIPDSFVSLECKIGSGGKRYYRMGYRYKGDTAYKLLDSNGLEAKLVSGKKQPVIFDKDAVINTAGKLTLQREINKNLPTGGTTKIAFIEAVK